MKKSPAYLIGLLSVYATPRAQDTVPRTVLEELKKDGLIFDKLHTPGTESAPAEWEPTARGCAYVEMLRVVPLPIQKWVDPR